MILHSSSILTYWTMCQCTYFYTHKVLGCNNIWAGKTFTIPTSNFRYLKTSTGWDTPQQNDTMVFVCKPETGYLKWATWSKMMHPNTKRQDSTSLWFGFSIYIPEMSIKLSSHALLPAKQRKTYTSISYNWFLFQFIYLKPTTSLYEWFKQAYIIKLFEWWMRWRGILSWDYFSCTPTGLRGGEYT